jgi:large conductance mechanosensitive channel
MMLKDFREFLLRGNLVDLAVAVVIGTAFTALVNAFVKSFITPLIAAVGGEPDFSGRMFAINGSVFRYEPPVSDETRDCPECLSRIPEKARRCAYCTAALQP